MKVTAQNLSDAGINPFAVQLLVESFRREPKAKLPVEFTIAGLTISVKEADVEPPPAERCNGATGGAKT